MGTTPAAAPALTPKEKLNTAVGNLITGGLQAAAMQGLKYVAGMAYEGNRAICDDPNTRIIEKTFCMVMKGLAGGDSGGNVLEQNLDEIANKLKEVDSKVTEINNNVKTILREMNLVHLEIAEAVVGADAYSAIRAIQENYDRFTNSILNLKDHPDQVLAYYKQAITETRLHEKIDTVFNSLIRGIADKESLLGNMIQQVETKGAGERLLTCYRVYEAYVNSILLDLRKGNTVVSSALLYFELLRQNGKLEADLSRKLADLAINNQSWRKQWEGRIDTLLDHFNTHWERFAINRSATAPADGTGPAPAQGINPFFFPEDAREAFRAADGFCSIQQESYGLRGRIFSMGGQFKGPLNFKDGSTAGATKTATLTINRKLDYWSATGQQPNVYNKVQFSDQWTVHRYHIPGAAAGTKELGIPLPYTPPAIEVTKCDKQTLQPSSSQDTAEFGSFVEIARAGGGFAFLSGAWSPGSEDKDASNTTNREVVLKVAELRQTPEFKIRYRQATIGKIGRPEVGLVKMGLLHHKPSSYFLEGTYRTWLETAKTIEFPTTSANEHIRLVWSLDPARTQTRGLVTADELNKLLRGGALRPTQPKSSITDDEVQSKPFIIGVNYDSTAAIPNQGCWLRAGFTLYPVWDGQKANAARDYGAIRGSALAGARQVGVFREGENKDNSVTQRLLELPSSRNLRFRFEVSYDLHVESSGLDMTPFALYARAELGNAYLELAPGYGGVPLPPAEVTLTSMLKRRGGRCFAFDYDHTGLLDHVMFYDVGGWLMAYGQVGNDRFDRRPLAWGERPDWELKSAADQVFAFDYTSSGKLDHLVIHRPGDGKLSVFRNNYGTLEPVLKWNESVFGHGFAFDFESKGKLDHLVAYHPGEGRIIIFTNKNGLLEQVWKSNQGLTGIPGFPGFDLKNAADRGFAFDFGSTGKLDHLVFYRPGAGKILIAKGSLNNATNFTPVYDSENHGNKGIGGYDLARPDDQAMAFDCDSTGHMDYLLFYRPGRGAIFVFKKNDKGNFDPPVYRRNEGGPGQGIGGYDLKNPADRIIALDYNGTGQADHLMLYRPGTGVYFIVKKTGAVDSKDFSKVG